MQHGFSHGTVPVYEEPFQYCKVIASPSADSKESQCSETGSRKHTAFSSALLNTFYSDRYLTTSRVKQLSATGIGIPIADIS